MHVTSTDRAEQAEHLGGSASEVLSVTLGPLLQELCRSPGAPCSGQP